MRLPTAAALRAYADAYAGGCGVFQGSGRTRRGGRRGALDVVIARRGVDHALVPCKDDIPDAEFVGIVRVPVRQLTPCGPAQRASVKANRPRSPRTRPAHDDRRGCSGASSRSRSTVAAVAKSGSVSPPSISIRPRASVWAQLEPSVTPRPSSAAGPAARRTTTGWTRSTGGTVLDGRPAGLRTCGAGACFTQAGEHEQEGELTWTGRRSRHRCTSETTPRPIKNVGVRATFRSPSPVPTACPSSAPVPRG